MTKWDDRRLLHLAMWEGLPTYRVTDPLFILATFIGADTRHLTAAYGGDEKLTSEERRKLEMLLGPHGALFAKLRIEELGWKDHAIDWPASWDKYFRRET